MKNDVVSKKKGKNKKKQEKWVLYLKGNYDLYLFLLPAIAVLFIFSYLPIYGVVLAFKDYSVSKGILGSTWVGLKHFTRFFSSAYFPVLMKNTLLLSLYSLAVGFPFPIILALLLNTIRAKWFKKTVQMVTYAPNFISTVVMCGMVLLFLSSRAGMVNKLLGVFGKEPVNFMAYASFFPHIYVWSGVWQTAGWNSVIYFAALSGISPQLHEAAMIDGASRLQRILHIDVPGILPTAIILLILNMGSIMSVGYEKVFLLQNNTNIASSEIIATYVYKMGILNNDISFSTAVGLFNSVINLVLLVVVNSVSKKLSENSLW